MFKSDLEVRASAPGEWALLSSLDWDDGAIGISVPAGFVTDLASIPPFMRTVIDRNGQSRRPAVLHDYLYQSGSMGRAASDRLFKAALKADGVGWLKRQSMYAGVRMFGWMFYREG